MRDHLSHPSSGASPTAKPMPAAQSNIAALTGLRFLAAFDVVLYHFARQPLPGCAFPLHNLIGSGFVAVNLFFLLSGFIMARSYLGAGGTLRGTPRSFYAARLARIYPAYLLGFLLAAPSNILTSLHVNRLPVAFAKLATNAVLVLTMQQAWTPWTAWAWNFPAWSVSVEAFFYLLFPFLAPRLARTRLAAWLPLAVALWLLALVAPAALVLRHGTMGPPHLGDTLQMAIEFTPLLRLPEFAIGILLGRAFAAGRFTRLSGTWLSLTSATLILAILAFLPGIPHPLLANGLLTPLFAALLVGLSLGGGPLAAFLALPPLVLLGEASYGLYILQVPVAFVIGMPPPLWSTGPLVFYCACLITAALLSARFVEAPLRDRLRRLLAGQPAGKPLAPPAVSLLTPPPTPGPATRRSVVLGAASIAGAAALLQLVRSTRLRRRQRIASAESATLIATTAAAPWQQGTLRPSGLAWNTLDLVVDLDHPRQVITGFGACFNELGWTSLQHLSPDDQDTIFRELFAPGIGASFNLCRMPIGANDFSRDWYSYDEVPDDFDLTHFSIANDRETLIPFIRRAQQENPALRLWASPWSPPSWMKRNRFYAEAQPHPGFTANGIRPDQVGQEGTDMFRLEDADDRYLRTYASYFGRFLDAYRAEGIPIAMVMPQNEFNSPQSFPSCTWTPAGLARFVAHLGPVLAARNVDLFFGTLERDNPSLLHDFLQHPQAARYTRGVGVQWAGREALPQVHQDYPELALYGSEQECGDGRNGWDFCMHCWDLMKFYFSFGTTAYMYWNISLLKGGESRWGWRQNSLITVDPDKGTFRFNHEFYLLKHVSHFVQPGARRVTVRGLMPDALAFLNPDRSVVVIARNAHPFTQSVDVLIGDRTVPLSLKADSISTLLLRPESSRS